MSAAFIAPNFAGIPAELRRLPRWVTWRAESEGGKTKPRKTPVPTSTGQMEGFMSG